MSTSGSSKKRRLSQASSSGAGTHAPNTRLPKVALPKFDDFQRDVEQAVAKVIPTGAATYGRIVLINIFFKHTELALKGSRDMLGKVLSNDYGAHIEEHQIDNSSSMPNQAPDPVIAEVDLVNALTGFHKHHTAEKNKRGEKGAILFIFYYSGHGNWVGRDKLLLHQIHDLRSGAWQMDIPYEKVLAAMTEGANTHWLVLLDCCYAGIAHLQGQFETVAASTWLDIAASAKWSNFTADIASGFQKLAKAQNPFSVPGLLNAIEKNMVLKNLPQPVYRPHQDHERRSIIITPLKNPLPSAKGLPKITNADKRALVTLSVTIEDVNTIPSAQEFKHWLTTNLPKNLRFLKIRTSWESASMTMVIAIPREIWHRLLHRTEYHILSFDWEEFTPESAGSDDDEDPLPLAQRDTNVRGGSSAAQKYRF